MARPISNYKKVLKVLEELHRDYPTWNMGRHLATALDDYGDFWGITDKELLFLLEKYRTAIELDSKNIVSEEYVQKIIDDSQNLENFYGDEEE